MCSHLNCLGELVVYIFGNANNVFNTAFSVEEFLLCISNLHLDLKKNAKYVIGNSSQ